MKLKPDKSRLRFAVSVGLPDEYPDDGEIAFYMISDILALLDTDKTLEGHPGVDCEAYGGYSGYSATITHYQWLKLERWLAKDRVIVARFNPRTYDPKVNANSVNFTFTTWNELGLSEKEKAWLGAMAETSFLYAEQDAEQGNEPEGEPRQTKPRKKQTVKVWKDGKLEDMDKSEVYL